MRLAYTLHRFTESGADVTWEVSRDDGVTWEEVRAPDDRPPWDRPFPLDALAPDGGLPAPGRLPAREWTRTLG